MKILIESWGTKITAEVDGKFSCQIEAADYLPKEQIFNCIRLLIDTIEKQQSKKIAP